MRIAFYADHHYWSQLANNGGTRTILLSAKTLNDMGHSAVVVAHKDKFTWFKHPKPVHKIPGDAEAVVAVTIADAGELLTSWAANRIKANRIAYWARPYETWQMQECDIFRLLKKFVKSGGVVMVNSEWQQKELAERDVSSEIVYQGVDLPEAGSNAGGPLEPHYYIGCQYSTKPRKGWLQFVKLREILGDSDFRYVAFGNEPCKEKWLTKYLRQPDRGSLARLYRGCHFFFCPNTLEGLYNPALEAALAGCLLVVSNEPRNGMMDFCDDGTAQMYCDIEGAAGSIRHPVPERVSACQERILIKIGARPLNMARMVEVLSA